MEDALAVEAAAIAADEATRQQTVRDGEWRFRQRDWDGVFPQWEQSAKVPQQTFGTFRPQTGNRQAWERVQAWISRPSADGFCLTGPVGTGKTHLVRAVGHQVRAARQHLLYTSVPYLLERLRDQRREAPTMDQVLRLHLSADVVIWDDLGAERPTEWTLDRLFLLLDARYEAQKPLLTTTNWAPSDLQDRLGDRIVSRLLEMGPMWKVGGPDERVRQAAQRLQRDQSA
jgi:DNA replication protein DnaC